MRCSTNGVLNHPTIFVGMGKRAGEGQEVQAARPCDSEISREICYEYL